MTQQPQIKSNKLPLHVIFALEDVGIVEVPKGSNRGDSISQWLGLTNIFYDAPWCGSFVGAKSRYGKAKPNFVSASARAYAVKGYAYQLSDIIYGNYIPKPGDWRVKMRKGGGHVDIFLAWDNEKQEGFVIGGNVDDGVRIRKVTLKSMLADKSTHIVDVKGYYNYQIPKKIVYEYDTLLATVYHDMFHGRRTASGEIFDQNKLTAASNEFKLGTIVEVINPRTKKSVKVLINDRMRNKGRIDLSVKAARAIKLNRDSVIIKYKKVS